jgi:hypothetical protein
MTCNDWVAYIYATRLCLRHGLLLFLRPSACLLLQPLLPFLQLCPQSNAQPPSEFELDKALEGLGLTQVSGCMVLLTMYCSARTAGRAIPAAHVCLQVMHALIRPASITLNTRSMYSFCNMSSTRHDPMLMPAWLQDQFIDFCILCGCDYAGTIKGIGPAKALKAIQVGEGNCAGGDQVVVVVMELGCLLHPACACMLFMSGWRPFDAAAVRTSVCCAGAMLSGPISHGVASTEARVVSFSLSMHACMHIDIRLRPRWCHTVATPAASLAPVSVEARLHRGLPAHP